MGKFKGYKRLEAKQKMAQILADLHENPPIQISMAPSVWKWLIKGFDDLSHSIFSLIFSLGIFGLILFVIRLAYVEQHAGMLFPIGLMAPFLMPLFGLFYIKISRARSFKIEPSQYPKVKFHYLTHFQVLLLVIICGAFAMGALRTGTSLLQELFPGPCPSWIELIAGFFCFAHLPIIAKNALIYLILLFIAQILTFVTLPVILYEQKDTIFAINKSVHTAIKNPKTFIKWTLVSTLLLLSSLFFGVIGSIIVIPIISHGYFHLYDEILKNKSS